ncbi:MAG TPA: hypothetical protein VKP88_07745 [Candidatus Paceibacterota bacterium]|nr:hypothetical protein [Candidatus Paceibacterota bacterium]
MHHRRSGFVWLASAAALGLYAAIGLSGLQVPGVEELLALLNQAEGWEFMAAGFLAILLEGLYVIGNFFPGTTTVLLLAVLSSVGSWWQFAGTILAIFLGWCVAGMLNIAFAYRSFQAGKTQPQHVFIVRDNVWLSWFPAFRANYEVSQVAAGGNVWQVIISALRVRFFASLAAAAVAALVAALIDLTEIDNEEGFTSILAIASIMLIVGWRELRLAQRERLTDHADTP